MRTGVLISALSLGVTWACCGGGGPQTDWTSLPPATPATYTAGTPVVDVSAVIGPAGGTLTGPAGTPVEGVVVTVPAGAVAAPTTFTLGHDVGGTFANVDPAELSGLVIVLDSDTQHEFGKPVSVEFPYSDPVRFPIPYYLRPDGRFELVQPLPVDRSAGRGGFSTWHASPYTWVNKGPVVPTQAVWNGFEPSLDGFKFSNTKDDSPYAPIGRCWGISAFTKWYKETYGGGLYSQFTTDIPTVTSKKVSLTGQEAIATRAHISVARKNTATSGMSQTQAVLTVLDALVRGVDAVMVGLADPKGNAHAVLAIGMNSKKISIYDSNNPGQFSEIEYEFNKTDEAKIKYGKYNVLDVWTQKEMPRLEKFDTILRDAQAGFNQENQTKIEITSHQNKEKVRDADITLEGKVHSGQVSISRLEVNFLKPDMTWSEIQVVELAPGHEDFSLALHTLGVGDNSFVFLTKGYGATGDELLTIPNDMGTQGEEMFSLTCRPGATSNITVSGSSTTISGPQSDPESRTEITANYSANLSYLFYPSSVRAIQNGTFPFVECTSSTVCQIVQGRTNPSMDPEDKNTNLPISVVYDEQEWTKTQNGFEKTRICHGEGALTWLPILFHIGVEPDSNQQNRQYRLVLKPGCGSIYLCPTSIPQPSLSCQCYDPIAKSWHDCSTSDPMGLPGFNCLMEEGNDHLDTMTPPRIPPEPFETFILTGTAPQTFSFNGVEDNTIDPNYTSTENVTVSLTLAP